MSSPNRMMFWETVQVSLEALRANKLRAFLTTLGLTIGVGAVITMVALGSGAQQAIQDRIQALGPTLLSVQPGQDFRGGVAIAGSISLTYADDTALANNARFVTDVVPELQGGFQIQFGNQNIHEDVIGTTPDFVVVRNYRFAAGRMFTPGEAAERQRYVIVESLIPTLLKTTPNQLVGKTLWIRGLPFEVLGVLAEKGTTGFGSSDDDLLVPFQTARYRLIGTDRLRTITISAANADSIQLAMISIERVLRRQHHIRPGDPDNFRIRSALDVLSTFQETSQTFGILLAGIASVSLLVGGIGIMNIVLATVLERTREIGIRRATGARRADIIRQFLLESVLISLGGGIVGIGFGYFLSWLIAASAEWKTIVTPSSIAIAFGVSVAVGVIFGIYPARKASLVDPIEALRYE